MVKFFKKIIWSFILSKVFSFSRSSRWILELPPANTIISIDCFLKYRLRSLYCFIINFVKCSIKKKIITWCFGFIYLFFCQILTLSPYPRSAWYIMTHDSIYRSRGDSPSWKVKEGILEIVYPIGSSLGREW